MGIKTNSKINNVFSFIWNEIIVALALTLLVKDPCKGKKCLIKACCNEHCELKIDYLKFCDSEGKILFQRVCALSIVFGTCMLIFHIGRGVRQLFL